MKRQFLEVGDLPKDHYGSLHKLRPTLVRVFNTARNNPAKLKLLKDTMKLMYNKCAELEKAMEKQAKEQSKEQNREQAKSKRARAQRDEVKAGHPA